MLQNKNKGIDNLQKSNVLYVPFTQAKWTFFGVHSRIFFINDIRDAIFFNYVDKISHIFGPKIDLFFEP